MTDHELLDTLKRARAELQKATAALGAGQDDGRARARLEGFASSLEDLLEHLAEGHWEGRSVAGYPIGGCRLALALEEA